MASVEDAELNVSSFDIVRARYGAPGQWFDVAEVVRKRMSDSNAREMEVNSEVLGEPAIHQAKRLEMTICDARGERPLNIDSGAILPLDGRALNDSSFQVPEIQQQVEAAYAQGDKRIKLEPKVYHIKSTRSQRGHLMFWGMKDFEIDATGSTLIFEHRDKCGIQFTHYQNVTLRGATLLRETPTFSQGDVRAVAKDHLDIEIDEGYPDDMSIPGFNNSPVLTFYRPDGIVKKGFPGEVSIKKIERLKTRLYRFYAGNLDLAQVAVGDMAAWRRLPVGTLNGEITVRECSGMTITGVTIKNSILVGIKESFCDGGNRYQYTVTYAEPPQGATHRPLLSSAADGFFSENSRQGPVLENCLLEGMHDDGINIHGKLWQVKEAEGTVARVAMWVLPPQEGDLFRFYDANHAVLGEATLVACRREAGDLMRLEFDKALQPASRSVLNVSTSGVGFVIRNCVTKNHRGRGFLIRPDHGLIENCLIEDLQRSAILVTPEFLTAQEGGYATDLIIRNNTFRRCNACCWGTGGVLGISSLQTRNWEVPWNGPWSWTPCPGGYRDILIEANRFEACDGPHITLSSAIGVMVKNNVFVRPMNRALNTHPPLPTDALVYVTESKAVQFRDNEIIDPGQFMKTPVSVTPTASVHGAQNGFLER